MVRLDCVLAARYEENKNQQYNLSVTTPQSCVLLASERTSRTC